MKLTFDSADASANPASAIVFSASLRARSASACAFAASACAPIRFSPRHVQGADVCRRFVGRGRDSFPRELGCRDAVGCGLFRRAFSAAALSAAAFSAAALSAAAFSCGFLRRSLSAAAFSAAVLSAAACRPPLGAAAASSAAAWSVCLGQPAISLGQSFVRRHRLSAALVTARLWAATASPAAAIAGCDQLRMSRIGKRRCDLAVLVERGFGPSSSIPRALALAALRPDGTAAASAIDHCRRCRHIR